METPIVVPEVLIKSVYMFFDSTVGNAELDPYIASSIINMATKMVETGYMMGFQDGKRAPDIREQLANTLHNS